MKAPRGFHNLLGPSYFFFQNSRKAHIISNKGGLACLYDLDGPYCLPSD
jgi:hypothetical protein